MSLVSTAETLLPAQIIFEGGVESNWSAQISKVDGQLTAFVYFVEAKKSVKSNFWLSSSISVATKVIVLSSPVNKITLWSIPFLSLPPPTPRPLFACSSSRAAFFSSAFLCQVCLWTQSSLISFHFALTFALSSRCISVAVLFRSTNCFSQAYSVLASSVQGRPQ